MSVLEIQRRTETNWDLCLFCQEKKNEKLVEPHKKTQYHKSYDSIQSDIEYFIEENVPLPFNMTKECLLIESETNLANSLLTMKAEFHKSCRDTIRSKEVRRFKDRDAKRKSAEEVDQSNYYSPTKKTRSSFESSFSRSVPTCVKCLRTEDQSNEKLHPVTTIGENLKEMALTARDWPVYTRLNEAFDSTAGDIHYHKSCQTALFNASRGSSSATQKGGCPGLTYDPLVIAELVAYIQHHRCAFKLVDLRNLYSKRLAEKKSNWIDCLVNPTRFKEHLLQKLGDEWQCFQESKFVILSPKSNTAEVLMEDLKNLTENECEKIIDVGLLLRRYILHSQPSFDGSFSEKSLWEPVPSPLLTLVQVMLEGATFLDTKDVATVSARTKVALTLSQLIISNSVKKGRKHTEELHQVEKRETPVPLYFGLKLDSNGRQKKLVKQFHRYGICVSYDRVKKVRTKLAKAVSKRYREDKVVVPTNCVKGIFTTGTTDNIDVSGRIEMHGTSITLIQHPNHENKGEKRQQLNLDIDDKEPVVLPDDFANVPFVEDFGGEVKLETISEGEGRPSNGDHFRSEEDTWLSHVRKSLVKDDADKWIIGEVPVTFSGFFSKKQNQSEVKPKAIIGTFPVFSDEKADSLSMMKHAMKVVQIAIDFLNKGQTPVMEGDLPLFARQKMCQWLFKDEVGEDMMVCMIGFLHLEMCTQEAGGKLLGGSGWERLFVQAKIHSNGVAVSLLGGHKIKGTRQAYLVTLAWLEVLRYREYEASCQGQGPHISIEMWEKKLFAQSPTANYWGRTIRDFLLKVCCFVRSQRLGNWNECINAIDSLCPYYFALGHTNYSRWVPVFLRDMARLPKSHPEVYKEYLNKNFVVQRSEKKFSLMGLDQSQEHSIKFLKEDSGPKGLYGEGNTEEKLVIELSKPEILRINNEFESGCFGDEDCPSQIEHSEGSAKDQIKFLNHVQSLLKLVNDGLVVNPYIETESQLVTLDTGEYMDPEISKSLAGLQTIGSDMHKQYVKERIEDCTKPISDVITKPKVYTFLKPPPVKLSKISKLSSFKASAAIATQMFISLQARPEADMADFFKYENSPFPPSITDQGKLRQGTKSQILECLPGIPDTGKNPESMNASVAVFDMPAVIHIVKPQKANLFGEYIPKHLLPFLQAQMNDSTTRIDAVWDRYPEKSLKNQARAKRLGTVKERRIRASNNVPIPKGKEWQNYLKVSENKEDLFTYLSDQLVNQTHSCNYHLLSTKGETVISNKPLDLSRVSTSDHEEADSRMILHLFDAAIDGHRKAFLRTVDSDVIVLCIHHFPSLKTAGMEELWVGFGKGKSYKDIPIHSISNQLGPDACKALPFFHAFTGCDLTSSMCGIGKKTAWGAWERYPEITGVMNKLTEDPGSVDEDPTSMAALEKWTVMMYSKYCSKFTVNEARQSMFTHNLKSLENIPPTQAALYQHVKRTLLVAAYTWHVAFRKMLNIPDPGSHGWEWNERLQQWVPFWTELEDASKACDMLLHCGCEKSCSGNCKCSKARKRCTPLCKCEAGCTRSQLY